MRNAIGYRVQVIAVFESVEKLPREWKLGADVNNPKEGFGYTPQVEATVRREVQIYNRERAKSALAACEEKHALAAKLREQPA